jgi:predicted NAD/FAD-dependent oxidoreductase
MNKEPLRVAVIGAGMAGLAAARALHHAGCQVLVLERNNLPGGRVTTRLMPVASPEGASAVLFDYGAQNIKADGTALGTVAQQVLDESDFAVVDAPVCLHEDHRVLAGDEHSNAERKWSCAGGMQQLAKTLASDLPIHYNTSVLRIEQDDEFLLHTDQSDTLDTVQRVIVTIPAPQAAQLLEASMWSAEAANMNDRIVLLRTVEYSRCLSVMLHFAAAGEDIPWYALLARDRSHPLLWLARENAKNFVPGGQGSALVAQLGHEVSCKLWDETDDTISRRTTGWIADILGDDFRETLQHEVYRWRYSQPRNTIDFDAVNTPGTRVLVCGDATARGRVPDAYDSGLQAAARTLQDVV